MSDNQPPEPATPPTPPEQPAYGSGSSNIPPGRQGHQSPQPTAPMQGTQGGGLGRHLPGQAMDALPDGAGFLGALFDFSFNRFVTPMLVKLVYVLATIYAVIVYVIIVIAGFTNGVFAGLIVLILGPIGAIIWLAVVRIGLEFGISVVRMSQDIHQRLPQA